MAGSGSTDRSEKKRGVTPRQYPIYAGGAAPAAHAPMPSDLAPAEPAVLRWARESIGVSLEEAARRADVTVERIVGWEEGAEEPTVAKLKQLAKLYQRPFAVFFLPEPPAEFDTIRDFRRLPDLEAVRWSRPLHKQYRRAIDQQTITAELLEEEGEEPELRLLALSLDVAPTDAGTTVRSLLGVDLQAQFSWRNPDEAFAHWLAAVEDLGILVLRTSEVPLPEMRGFSLSEGAIPVIVVNALDSTRGQIFSLIHELIHVLLNEGGLCILLEPESGSERAIEVYCNAVAAEVLMPEVAFLSDPVVAGTAPREWDDEELVHLSQRFSVSREAALRRLVTLGRATMDFYLSKREAYLVEYEERREDERRRRREGQGGGPLPHRMAMRDRGRPYMRLVLDAYHRDTLSAASASTLLGLKTKWFSSLEREIGG